MNICRFVVPWLLPAFLLWEHNHGVLLDDKQCIFCKVVGSFIALRSLAICFRHPLQSFPFLNILIFSFKGFSMIDSHLSRGCFFRQATHKLGVRPMLFC